MLTVKHSLQMMTSRRWPKDTAPRRLLHCRPTLSCVSQCWQRSSFQRCWCENAVSTTAKFSSCKNFCS